MLRDFRCCQGTWEMLVALRKVNITLTSNVERIKQHKAAARLRGERDTARSELEAGPGSIRADFCLGLKETKRKPTVF